MLLLLVACNHSTTKPDDTGPADSGIDETGETDSGDTDEGGETGDTGDSGIHTGDTSEPRMLANHVVLSYTVAARGEGFDVDGDGETDNAIWALGGVLDPMIAEGLATAQHVVIAQINGVADWTNDPKMRVGVLTAEDPDGDGTNNGSGVEVYVGGAQVDANGEVYVATNAALMGGIYSAEIATGAIPVGSYELELATGLYVRAEADAAQQSGLLGFGIALDKLEVALTAEGASKEVLALLAGLADLDLDADGTNDGLSMAFHFRAGACTVTP